MVQGHQEAAAGQFAAVVQLQPERDAVGAVRESAQKGCRACSRGGRGRTGGVQPAAARPSSRRRRGDTERAPPHHRQGRAAAGRPR